MAGCLLLFLLSVASANGGDFWDIGLEYLKVKDIYYWTSPVTAQLIFQIPLPTTVSEFAQPRCEYAINTRKSLLLRFRQQFPVVAEVPKYKAKCDRFGNENETSFRGDTEEDCYKCFHMSSDNDPYYLECLALLELRLLCNQKPEHIGGRRKRDTEEHYVLSNIAVSLAESAKTQDDRVTSRFRQEHDLQKENVNFQLLFLNTFRWQLSLSELWFLQYIQSDPELFAKILVQMSGIVPKTRDMVAKKINTSLSEEWSIQSTKRNDTHVTVNLTFTAFHPEFKGQLFKFRFLPVSFDGEFVVISPVDAFLLDCGRVAVTVSSYDAHKMTKTDFIPDSPCHQNHGTSDLENCMKRVLIKDKNARPVCLKDAQTLKRVNNFYFTLHNKIWLPANTTLSFVCPKAAESGEKTSPFATVLSPECHCEYAANFERIPATKTCSSKHALHQVESDFKFWHQSRDPFFLGEISNDTSDPWTLSAVNSLAERNVERTQMTEEYFRKKLESEQNSISSQWSFKLGLSSLWIALPVLGVVFLIVIGWFKCRNSSDGSMPIPVFVNHCNHGAINLRDQNPAPAQPKESRVVSWQAGEGQGASNF